MVTEPQKPLRHGILRSGMLGSMIIGDERAGGRWDGMTTRPSCAMVQHELEVELQKADDSFTVQMPAKEQGLESGCGNYEQAACL